MQSVKKKYFNVLMVVVVGYCVKYIILLCCLYYFNVLNVKWVIKRDKVVF